MENQEASVEKVPTTETIQGTEIYPKYESMTFRGHINSEKEGIALLRAIQIIVNELGTQTILQLMAKLESKPQLMVQAKNALPYILNM